MKRLVWLRKVAVVMEEGFQTTLMRGNVVYVHTRTNNWPCYRIQAEDWYASRNPHVPPWHRLFISSTVKTRVALKKARDDRQAFLSHWQLTQHLRQVKSINRSSQLFGFSSQAGSILSDFEAAYGAAKFSCNMIFHSCKRRWMNAQWLVLMLILVGSAIKPKMSFLLQRRKVFSS